MTVYDKVREYPRHVAKVLVRAIGNDEKRNFEFTTINISEGGLAVTCEKPPFVGEVLKLEIQLGHGEPTLEIKSEVIWRKEGDGCGFRFFKLTARQRETLMAYLSKMPLSPR